MSSLYDEFGNYIGPDVPSDEEEEQQQEQEEEAPAPVKEEEEEEDTRMKDEEEENVSSSRAVILHEDKKYYPGADEVYGGVETLVEEEDAQTLETPLVAPVKEKRVTVEEELKEQEREGAEYPDEFLVGLQKIPELIRNVVVSGHLHHGKTSFIDILVRQTHPARNWDIRGATHFTDTRKDEQERSISVKATAVELALPDSRGKHFAITLIDTPGHPCFSDEITSSIRLCDGMVLIIDAVEGMLIQSERSIRHAIRDGLPIVLIINKIDRLILELRLPPQDSYHKIRYIIEDVNAIISSCSPSSKNRLSPELGNVLFASSEHGWCFTLETFAKIYFDKLLKKTQKSQQQQPQPKGLPIEPDRAREAKENFSTEKFAKKLWGDYYFHRDTRSFKKEPPSSKELGSGNRSFVEFVLEPLYKIYSTIVGEDTSKVQVILERELGVRLKPSELKLDASPLLRIALSRFLGNTSGFVDMITKHIPRPNYVSSTESRVKSLFKGPLDSPFAKMLLECNPHGNLFVHVSKLYSRGDGSRFDALARIESGTLHVNEKVVVMGESFMPGIDEEDSTSAIISQIWLPIGRYRISVSEAIAGMIVLLEGIDETITRTATIVRESDFKQQSSSEIYPYKKLNFDTRATMKIAVEPLNPSDLPKMLEGLRRVGRAYPLCTTRREESGEHTVFGTGELYLDCALRDLREVYGDVEVKVSDPVVSFCETVSETSSIKCFAKTPNGNNKLTMIAEPLESGIAEESESLESNALINNTSKLRNKYGWDLLAVKSLWAFGPDSNRGTNVILDDTLADEANKELLYSVKKHIIQGFQWAVREGPLCEEPVRGVKFRILGAELSNDEIQRGGVQIIPTTRRVCYSAFLTASPRLMEPVFICEIYTPQDCVNAIYTVISRRRGQIANEKKCAGTPLQILRAFMPIIDSFGFETDIRTHTQGQAFCLQLFDHWAIVPGDPCDKSVVLRPLEPTPTTDLARDFMIKTRRRKGLSEDVSIAKFFDQELRDYIESQAAPSTTTS